MEEESKINLYKQLMKFKILAKLDEELIEWDEFAKKKYVDIFKYTLSYRDKCLEMIKEQKNVNKIINDFYLEIPNIDLEGEDLSKVYLHMFMPGVHRERNNGKRIFISTNINLKDTNCVINMATIRPIVISKDGENIEDIVADIEKCNFTGCIVFGKFQNTKARLLYKRDSLPKEYIERLEKYKVPEDAIKITDEMYINMCDGKHIKGSKEIEKVKQMVDYDLTRIGKEIWEYEDVICKYHIDISFTGAFIKENGFESLGKENELIDISLQVKEAYKKGDLDYIESIFDTLDSEVKKKIVSLALKDDLIDFVKKHQKELSPTQKKYFELESEKIEHLQEEEKIKVTLRNMYKEGKIDRLAAEIRNVDKSIRSDLIKEAYEDGQIDFVQKYLDEIQVDVKNEIIEKEYKKGNEKFVYRNFKRIANKTIKEEIINKELQKKNSEFLCNNYFWIDDEKIREKVRKMAFDEGKLDFIRLNFDDYPKNMQLEAIIKFKDLGIPESTMLELLKS